MKIVYAATHAEKHHTEQAYRCEPNTATRTCMLSTEIDLVADTLRSLVTKLGLAFQVEMRAIRFDRHQSVSRLRVVRLEDVDGEPPSGSQRDDWREGRETLYHAEYAFMLEMRHVHAIPMAEIQSLGQDVL